MRIAVCDDCMEDARSLKNNLEGQEVSIYSDAESRAVSKLRLDVSRGCIGMLTSEDFEMVKEKIRLSLTLEKSRYSE